MANDERIKKLQLLLKDLFQFENNDLDFGIYRIINIKRKEISEFIDKELFDIIKEKIKTVEDNTELQKSLEILKNEIKITFGCDIQEAKTKYAETPKVNEYINKEKELKVADKENEIEEEIYDDIINFFSRYYDKGDFISKRRYSKDNKYAIPYNGEEVYLYWANNDQYYVKTSEDFKNYYFNAGELKVSFKIESEEVDVEKNNIKDEKEKFFIFKDADYDARGKKLVIKFGYRELSEEEKQEISESSDKEKIGKDEVNGYNFTHIQEKIGIYGLSDMQKKHTRIDGEKSDKSELGWHLNKYTTKNTSDYFIHKDLKKFLNQELDFYIKNELLHIDDIDSKQNFDISLKRVRVFKEITLKIIQFLSQIEDFQKKLWEKKKFVISTDYCITLDLIDEKHYSTILKNQVQLEEWKNLYSFDIDEEVKKLKGKLTGQGENDKWKKNEILKQNPTLVLDTKFYDDDFKYQILSEIENLDKKTTGILINSENFQALNLLLNKYKEKIKCCYFDPPYNRGDDEFLYKDGFKHSSWLTMIKQSTRYAHLLLNSDGAFFISCDENEMVNLGSLLQSEFGVNNHFETIIWNKRVPKNDKGIGNIHEYIYLFCPNALLRNALGKSFIMRKDALEEIYAFVDKLKRQKLPLLDAQIKLKEFYSKQGFDRGITLYCELDPNYEIWGKINMSWPNPQTEGPRYEIINPITTKPVPIPKKGWRWIEETFHDKENTDPIYVLPDGCMMKGRIWYSTDVKTQPSSITYLREVESFLLRSVISLKSDGSLMLEQLGLTGGIDYPKPVRLMERIIYSVGEKDGYFLDSFAGSGTTGHAVLTLNKEDNGHRKFILMEMGQYFDSVLKRRILKVIYSDNWKEGKPQDNDGSKSQIIKYQTLEQYEDSLNNIDFKEPNTLAKESKDYKIKYMLEFEAKDNNVFLNLDAIDNPFEYKLKIENKECNIDLIETFNYIAGIDVKSIQRKQNMKVDYVIVKGQRKDKDVIVIWRNKTDGFDPKNDKEFVETEILKEEYDEIFVNGDSLMADAKSVDEILKSNMLVE